MKKLREVEDKDMVMPLVPVRKYKVKLNIRSVKKGRPRLIYEEELEKEELLPNTNSALAQHISALTLHSECSEVCSEPFQFTPPKALKMWMPDNQKR